MATLFPKGKRSGTKVMVQVYNPHKRKNEWIPGILEEYQNATDKPYRVLVTCNRYPAGVAAAPECVKLKNK